MIAKEITTPGDHQIKAMFVSCGQPGAVGAQRRRTRGGARQRSTCRWRSTSTVTETTARCDYVLPVTTMYERDDFPLTFQAFQATPFRQATEAVVAPRGRSRVSEWEIDRRADAADSSGRQLPADGRRCSGDRR